MAAIDDKLRFRPRFDQLNAGADYSAEEADWLRAIARYQKANRRPFLSWTEILAIAISEGWRRTASRQELPAAPAKAPTTAPDGEPAAGEAS